MSCRTDLSAGLFPLTMPPWPWVYPWLCLPHLLWAHDAGSPELMLFCPPPSPRLRYSAPPCRGSLQALWRTLGLESLTSYCSSPHPLVHSTVIFLSESLWSPGFHFVSIDSGFLSRKQELGPGRKCRFVFSLRWDVFYLFSFSLGFIFPINSFLVPRSSIHFFFLSFLLLLISQVGIFQCPYFASQTGLTLL